MPLSFGGSADHDNEGGKLRRFQPICALPPIGSNPNFLTIE
jgi:hypothetical protein